MGGRLPRVTGSELIRALERDGWVVVRVNGSHHHLRHPDRRGLPVVPVHGNRTMGPGLLKDVLRDTDMTVERLKSLL